MSRLQLRPDEREHAVMAIVMAVVGFVLALAACGIATVAAHGEPNASGVLRLVWILCAVIVVLAGILAALGVAALALFRHRRSPKAHHSTTLRRAPH